MSWRRFIPGSSERRAHQVLAVLERLNPPTPPQSAAEHYPKGNRPMPSRIYLVSQKGREPRLVEATHPAQAVGHVARDQLAVEIASQQDLVDLVKKGTRVEKAGEKLPVLDDRRLEQRRVGNIPLNVGQPDERVATADRRVASNGGA